MKVALRNGPIFVQQIILRQQSWPLSKQERGGEKSLHVIGLNGLVIVYSETQRWLLLRNKHYQCVFFQTQGFKKYAYYFIY